MNYKKGNRVERGIAPSPSHTTVRTVPYTAVPDFNNF
jgi:hypothetical protein